MKNKFSYLIVLLFFNVYSFAQNNSWNFGPNYSDVVNQPLPLPTTQGGYSGQPATGAQNIISDASGQIKFFIVNQNIYDRTGALIDEMTYSQVVPSFWASSGYQVRGVNGQTAVVPVPGSCEDYYIIGTDFWNADQLSSPAGTKTFYGKLKVRYNADGTLHPCSGLSIFGDPDLDLDDKMRELASLAGSNWEEHNNIHDAYQHISVSEEVNGERFLFVAEHRNIYRFKINAIGITYHGKIAVASINNNANTQIDNELSASECEVVTLSNGNLRLTLPVRSMNLSGSQSYDGYLIIDLNPQTGAYISSSEKMLFYNRFVNVNDLLIMKGAEFSRGGTRFYLTHNSTANYPGSTMDMFDLTTANPFSSRQIISGMAKYAQSHIERISGDRIIIPTQTNLELISNASNPIFPIDLTTNFLPLANYSAQFVLNSTNPSNNTRLLQHQIDDMDYVSYLTEGLECCRANSSFDIDVFEATENGTWLPFNNPLNNGTGGTVTIRKELRIKAGVSVTIENMNLYFAPGARVVVENGNNQVQGAILRLGRCLLTIDGTCGYADLWKGIEVWGNQNMTQGSWSNSSQGRLETYSITRIENAWIGVLVGKRQELNTQICPNVFEAQIQTFAFDDTRTGGVIRIQPNTVFYNNQRGINMRPYIFNGWNNSSFVHKSKFEWSNNTILGGFNVQAHILLESVKGIRILGCEFLNTTTNFTSPVINGIGIQSRASQFIVDNYCAVNLPFAPFCMGEVVSTFTNLAFGIHASNPIDNLTFSVNRSNFINCSRGVYAIATRNERITLNTIKVRQATYETYGIYLERSSGYIVQENNVIGGIVNGSPSDMRAFGIVANSSGVANNLIYKNDLGKNLFVGIYNSKINGSAIPQNVWQAGYNAPSTGLKLRCNNFYDDIHRADIEISGIINYTQGSATFGFPGLFQYIPAGNLFSADMNAEHDIMVSPGSQGIRYIHMANPQANIPNAYTLPNYVHPISVNGWLSQSNHCRSLLGAPIPTLVQNYQAAKAKENELAQIMKGGDTEVLLSAIQQAAASITTKDLLIQYSPFLADEVLISYLNSSANAGMKKDVFQSNTKLSDTVMLLVVSSNLPQGTKNQIIQAQNSTNQKDQVIDSYNHYHFEADQYFNEVLSRMLLDTTQTMDYEEVIAFLNETNDKKSKKMLIDIHLSKGNMNAMQQVKNALYEEEDLEDNFEELQEIKEQIATYSTVEEAMLENSISMAIDNLITTASDDYILGKSIAFNEFLNGPKDVPELGPFGASMMMISTTELNESTIYTPQQVVSIYPNPSTGQVYFDYPEHQEGILSIQLMDLSGKIVYSYNSQSESNGERVDLSSVKKGMYMVRISIDGAYIETQKLLLK